MKGALQVVTITADELRTLVREACTAAVLEASRSAAAAVDRVSAARAARIARKRRELVLTALNSGALPGQRSGRDWSIRVGDLDKWASAGFPVAKAVA